MELKEYTLGHPHSIRFNKETEEAIYSLTHELDSSFSQVVRELVAIALSITHSADKITLKDLLIAFKGEFVKSPYYSELVKVVEDEESRG